MNIVSVHSYLVPPRVKEGETPRRILGTTVKPEEELFGMVQGLFDDAPSDCPYRISFVSRGGEQSNACLTLVFDYVQDPAPEKGREIAEALREATTRRSGLGLLFLILGRDESDNSRLVVSRFPADEGVLAQEGHDGLSVAYVKQVFMKSEKAYKCAMYEGAVVEDFWRGRAVDKQINSSQGLSDYWIRTFLQSDFAVTGERGTRQLAVALRETVKNTEDDQQITDEISSAVTLSPSLDYQSVSIKEYTERFHMSEKTTDAIKEHVKAAVFEEQFRFLHPEFKKHIAYKRVEMDNGAVLTALTGEFDEVFNRSRNDQGEVVFTTRGEIKTERYRKRIS